MDHPIGKGVMLFLLLINVFFIYVNVINLGMYGYMMAVDVYVLIGVLIAFFGVGFEYGTEGEGWRIEMRWYGLLIKKSDFDNAWTKQDGKMYNVWVEKSGVKKMTWIMFDEKDMEFFKLVFNK